MQKSLTLIVWFCALLAGAAIVHTILRQEPEQLHFGKEIERWVREKPQAFRVEDFQGPRPLTAGEVKRLCRAIAVSETGGCTTGSALTHRNCHGLMRKGEYIDFNTLDDSFEMCERVWLSSYRYPPDLRLASKWSSPGAAMVWLANVQRSLKN